MSADRGVKDHLGTREMHAVGVTASIRDLTAVMRPQLKLRALRGRTLPQRLLSPSSCETRFARLVTAESFQAFAMEIGRKGPAGPLIGVCLLPVPCQNPFLSDPARSLFVRVRLLRAAIPD